MKRKSKPSITKPERAEQDRVQDRHLDVHIAAQRVSKVLDKISAELKLEPMDEVFVLVQVLHRRMCGAWWNPKMDKILKGKK